MRAVASGANMSKLTGLVAALVVSAAVEQVACFWWLFEPIPRLEQ